MKKIGGFSHTRLIDPTKPDEKGSSVWTGIITGFKTEVKRHPGLFSSSTVSSVKKAYHDMGLFCDIIEKGVALKLDAMVTPMTPKGGPAEDRFLDIIDKHKGIIVSVNVEATKKAAARLGSRYKGHVGPDEKKMAQMAAEGLLSRVKDVKHIVIPNDKPDHSGYVKRVKYITKVASQYGVSVEEIPIRAEDADLPSIDVKDGTGVIGLGPVGTRFAKKLMTKYPDKVVGATTMDLDQETEEGIRSGQIACAIIQFPEEQGAKAVRIAADALLGKVKTFKKVLCKPFVIDKTNVGKKL